MQIVTIWPWLQCAATPGLPRVRFLFFPFTFFPPIFLIFILYRFKGLDYEEAFEESANIENNCQLMLPPFSQVRAMICRYIDEGVPGSGMVAFPDCGHWQKMLPQNSKGTVYGVLFSPPVAEMCARLASNFCL